MPGAPSTPHFCDRPADAVRRIDELFAIERQINGVSATDRLAARDRESRPIIADLERWMRTERARLSRHAETAKAIDYVLTRWPAFTRFLDDGRIPGEPSTPEICDRPDGSR